MIPVCFSFAWHCTHQINIFREISKSLLFQIFSKSLKAQRCLRSYSCMGSFLVNKSKMQESCQSHRFLLFTNSNSVWSTFAFQILSKTSLRIIKFEVKGDNSRSKSKRTKSIDDQRSCAELVSGLNGWEFTDT